MPAILQSPVLPTPLAMTDAIFAFPECMTQGRELAALCDVPLLPVHVRRFPDGESLVRIEGKANTAFLYRSLDDPNAKLVELVLAASALRDSGASRVILIAPYLAYMRQDMAFHEGEAVSQKVVGRLLADHFDGIITVDPHLHRIASLAEVIKGIPAISVSAAPAIAAALAQSAHEAAVLVGPDSESRQWVQSIAEPLGLEFLVGEKVRKGDRKVNLVVTGIEIVEGRSAVLVDDMISSGTTLIECAALLHAAGARSVAAIVTHALSREEDLKRLAAAGIAPIRAADSTASSIATIPLAGVLADAIRNRDWTASTRSCV